MEQIEDYKQCHCPCHEPSSKIIHAMACCTECNCGQKVKHEYWEEHMASCEAMAEEYAAKQRRDGVKQRIKSFMDMNAGNTIKRI